VDLDDGSHIFASDVCFSHESHPNRFATTLPTNSAERKQIPLSTGCMDYFPAALAEVARVSKEGNDQHHKDQTLHHARGKSMDHEDAMLRHHVDARGLRAQHDRGDTRDEVKRAIIREKAMRAWRALADLQGECEELAGAPLAPGARLPE
jgi:hypothetical protein